MFSTKPEKSDSYSSIRGLHTRGERVRANTLFRIPNNLYSRWGYMLVEKVNWDRPHENYKCKRHGPQKPIVHRVSRERTCRICQSDRNRVNRQKLKLEVIAAYGGACVCCGEREPVFLCIDHIAGDGAKHRLSIGGGNALYLWLKRRHYPKNNFQLLCHNCNWAKERGGCPHRFDLEKS